MKILFISKNLYNKNQGGERVSKRNFKLLDNIYGKNNIDIITFGLKYSREKNVKVLKSGQSKFISFINGLFQYIPPMKKSYKDEILKQIQNNNYDLVFLDSSCYGNILKEIYLINKDIKLITFFHNIEYIYHKELVKVSGFKYLPLVYASYFNEKNALKYSDKIICLNERDDTYLKSIYGEKADLLLPVSFQDQYKNRELSFRENEDIEFGLFVGSYFFANYEGIKWFKENVSDSINCKIKVVGKNMEKVKDELETSNLEIVGTVDDLSSYYNEATFVIAPIFSGSGMKVKIAEALMYGKTIFGTDEAFEGYNFDINKVGSKCNTAEEFIEEINQYLKTSKRKYNQKSREIFLRKYSFEKSINKFKEILNK